MTILKIITATSAIAFIYYGWMCLFSRKMRLEFERLGQARFRVAIGILQFLGAAGLWAGLYFPVLGAMAATGIALMMGAAVALRIRNRNGFLVTLPAFAFMVLNAAVAAGFFKLIN